jgi:uncharacterized protein (TIGR02611 family)
VTGSERSEPAHRRAVEALVRGRERVRALPGGTWTVRVVVTTAGVAVIALGIVLLPLPGPGWLIIFSGLAILATEYAWAGRLLRRTRRYVEAWTRWALRQTLFVRGLIGLGGLVFIGGVLVLCWWLMRLW